jgi:peptidyl-prolyl cis-trans isomerase D
MLDLMRKHAQSWFIKLLLGGIVVTFISWGGYSRYQQRANTVAFVNGEALGTADFERAYQRVVQYYRAQLGDKLDETALKAMGVRQKVYDELVDRMLVLQEAARLGVGASQEQIRVRIATMPAFQVDGRFNEEAYRKVLAANQLTPAAFEEQQRTDLAMENLRRLVSGFAKVSEAEAQADWRDRNEKVTLDYASFRPADFQSQVKISPEDMAKYFETRKENFRQPPRVRLGYVELNKEAVAAGITPPEAKLRQAYEEYKDDYWTPKEVRARHILLSVPAGATKDVERKIEERIFALQAQLKAGADFSELAKKNSQDPVSAAKGGDLGWFGEDQMVADFSEAAFALPKGGLSGPVRTDYGFHLIKVDDIREPRLRPFEEVRAEVAKEVAGEMADALIEKRLEECYGQVAKLGGLKAYAQARGLSYQETGPLPKGQGLPGIADSVKVVSRGLSKKKGEFDVEMERREGPVLLQVLEQQDSYLPPLAEVEGRVRAKMASEKAVELASKASYAALADVKGGASLQQAAAKHDGKAGRVGPFQRAKVPPEVGQQAGLAAFHLSPEQPLSQRVLNNGQGPVLIKLVEKQEASPADWAAQRQETTARLLSMKKAQMFETWLKELRQKADIEVVNKVD